MRRLLIVPLLVCTALTAACGSNGNSGNKAVGASSSATHSAAGSSAPADNGDETTVKVGILPIIDVAPLYLGQQKGIFAKHGLKLQLETVQTGAAATASVMSGEYQFGFAAPVPEIQAQAKGLPITVVANAISQGDSLTQAVVVKKGSSIQSVKDLAGKTIAVNALQAVNELVVRAVADKEGVNEKALKFIALAYPDMQSALTSGRVDAAYLIEPFLSAGLAAGDQVVIQNPQQIMVSPSTTYSSYFATQSYVKNNAKTIKDFVDAVAEANAYADAHPDEVRSIISTYTAIKSDVASKIKIGKFAPTIDQETYQVMGKEMVNLGWIKTAPNLGTLLYTP